MPEDERPRPKVRADRAGHTLVLTLDRPEVRNAVDAEVHAFIGAALEAADADPQVRAIVLTGAGEVFCAGADLAADSAGIGVFPLDETRRWSFAGFVAHPVSTPTIVAVNGAARGGGTELVLAADLAVCAQNATFGLPEVSIGTLPAGGGAIRLPRQIPHKVAMEMLLTGRPIDAQRAREIGLVNRVVPRPDVLDAALELADAIAANAPLAVQATKRIARGYRVGRTSDEEELWERSDAESAALDRSRDLAEGLAAFHERRPPSWQAR